ncbi:probable UDP-sugar transporter protein SLC35A4 isoform X2 [Garra rufa]|uniref:probable UDP-sugar transporter protein SLC35A4 isoform X2 n=1 Tax=Garra rufa TaxID=137080 RepID=UPI003CCEAF94
MRFKLESLRPPTTPLPPPDPSSKTPVLVGGSLLASPFLKGFLAGYVISRLRSSAVLGVALGTLTGIYAAQNYEVPNIETSLRDFLNSLKKGPSD